MKRILAIILLTLTICSCEASKILKTNTAVVLAVGPFVDFSDGVTPETAMTVTNITMELYKETDEGSAPTRAIGVNPTASGGSNDMVHITSDVAGFYSLELTATQLNFTGRATLVFTDADAILPVFVAIHVLPANVFDALVGTDALQVHANEITADLITAAAIASDAIGAAEIGASAIGSSEIGTGAIDADSLASDAITSAKIGADAIGASELATDAIGAAELATDAIGSSEVALDAITSSEIASSAVSEIQSGIALSADLATVDSVVDAIKVKTDSLTFTTAGEVDARIESVGATAVSGPSDLKADVSALATSAQVSALNNISTAQVNAEVDSALLDYDPPTKAELDAGLAALNDPTSGEIADAVLDEAISGHLTAGSVGNSINSAGSAGDPWGTSLPGAYGSGSAGYILGNRLDATVSSRSSHSSPDLSGLATLDSIESATAEVLAAIPSSSEIAAEVLSSTVTIGDASVSEILRKIASWGFGKFTKSGDVYTYYDDDGSTVLFTFTISTGGRTP